MRYVQKFGIKKRRVSWRKSAKILRHLATSFRYLTATHSTPDILFRVG